MSNDKSSAKQFPKQEQSLPGSQQEQHPSPKVLPKRISKWQACWKGCYYHWR